MLLFGMESHFREYCFICYDLNTVEITVQYWIFGSGSVSSIFSLQVLRRKIYCTFRLNRAHHVG
jgi:hypothetical protein